MISFTLHTTIDDFLKWLNNYALTRSITVDTAYRPGAPLLGRPDTWLMILTDPDKRAITLELLAYAPLLPTEGLEIVTPQTANPDQEALLADILKAISWQYPEAFQEIRTAIQPEKNRPQDTMTGPPEKPERDAGLERWIEYYYKMRAAGYNYTLRDVANETGYSYTYVRQKKSEYDTARRRRTNKI